MTNPTEVIANLRERDLYELAVAIAKAHHCTVHEMVSSRRSPAFCAARHAMWAQMYALGWWSYPRIAELFGRDHTTIMSGVAKVKAMAA